MNNFIQYMNNDIEKYSTLALLEIFIIMKKNLMELINAMVWCKLKPRDKIKGNF